MRTILIILISVFWFISGIAQNDSLNRTDANNLKQGWWIIYDNSKTKKLEEGKFADSKKEGIWKSYYETGQVKTEITYVANKPDGYAKFYYDNGVVSEEGLWKGSKWVGNYKYYHKNGNPSYEWSYNEQGKRTGTQKYFHENGKIMIEGNWQEGKEAGVIKEFDENGKLVAEKSYNDGKLDENSVKVYNATTATNNDKPPVDNTANTNNTTIVTNTTEAPGFLSDGFHKTYNKDKKVDKEGEFRSGKLLNGKRYYYDETGKLTKTVIYKNGVVSETILPK